MQTGRWRKVRAPAGLTSSDEAVAAAGVAVVRDAGPAGARWWAFDPTPGTWRRLTGVPAGATAPEAFGSEVYALAGRRVVVYSVALDRWTPLSPDPLRPALVHRQVGASRAGTVVTGRAGAAGALVADRWDGTRWRRTSAAPTPATPPGLPPDIPPGVDRRTSTVVPLGGRLLVVSRGVAWIHSP